MVALRGPLGAGKTTFVRAVVRALHGSDDAVSSPTFIFRQRYDGTPPIEHVDLYRIQDPAAELPDLALDDAFAPDRIALVEWPERAAGCLPADRIEVAIEGSGDEPPHGPRAAPRHARTVRILALDAALDGFSAALDDGARLHVAPGGRQDALERGLARIEDLLSEAGLRLRDLDRIAVGVGPGSFTGVRIAVAYAKSLAYGSGVPLVGVSSYDALEPDGAPLPLLAVVQGRRGVVCARLRDAEGVTTACGAVSDVLERLLPKPLSGLPGAVHVTGNTEDVISEIAERGWTVQALGPRADVPAVAILQLARTREPSLTPHALAPDYGEAPAVTRPKS